MLTREQLLEVIHKELTRQTEEPPEEVYSSSSFYNAEFGYKNCVLDGYFNLENLADTILKAIQP